MSDIRHALSYGPINALCFSSSSIRSIPYNTHQRNRRIALFAGSCGGVLSRIVAPPAVFAQAQPFVQWDIRAESLGLVDDRGSPVGAFTTPARRQKRVIVLFDKNGNQIWSAGDSALRQLTEK
jgi:hypothetical protein